MEVLLLDAVLGLWLLLLLLLLRRRRWRQRRRRLCQRGLGRLGSYWLIHSGIFN
jgi:hypothetical protein